jgi:hypothetical protein
MKMLRWMAVPVLAVSTVACGSDSDSAGSSEEWCDVATVIESKFDSIGDAFGGTPEKIEAMFDDITTELDDAVDKAPSAIEDEVKMTQDAVADMKRVLSDADYNMLDVDMGELEKIMANTDMEAAGDKIEAYNAEECGIAADTTVAATDDSTSDTLGEGTARDQIVESLQAIGLTKDEATCVAENIDPAIAASASSDPTQMMAVFETCDIGLERLAELGVQSSS